MRSTGLHYALKQQLHEEGFITYEPGSAVQANPATSNIAKVVAANTGKRVEAVVAAMLDRSTLNPEEATSWGLVHEVRSELFPEGSEVISIQ